MNNPTSYEATRRVGAAASALAGNGAEQEVASL